MLPYDKLAIAYDRIGMDRFSVRMVDYAVKLLENFRAEPRDGLDLCCGTGTAIRELSDHGIMMEGLDRSTAMLSVARRKLAGRSVKLHRQNLPRFEIVVKSGGRKQLRRYDLVTSFFDSLNYQLTERDLKATFASVYRHLKPGGWFLFDMNTAHAMRTVFTTRQPEAGVTDKVAWVFRNDANNDRDQSAFLLTFFVKEGRAWRRYDETHRERAYPNTTIARMLRETGFQVKGMYRCLSFEKPTRSTNRIAVVARRKP